MQSLKRLTAPQLSWEGSAGQPYGAVDETYMSEITTARPQQKSPDAAFSFSG